MQSLGSVEDTTRVVQKFLSGRGDSSDLLAVRDTIGIWTSISNRIQMEKNTELQRQEGLGEDWTSLNMLLSGMCDLRPLADSINLALLKGDAVPGPTGPLTNEMGDVIEVSDVDVDSMLTSHVSGGWTIRPE